MRATPVEERGPIGGTALLVAKRIHLKFQVEIEFAPEFVDHYEQFGIAGGVRAAEDFDAELMELTKAPLLRALASEHRTRIIETLLRIAAVEAGLNVGTHH